MRAVFHAMVASSLLLAGCVSSGTHKETLDELAQVQAAKSKTDADFEAYKSKTTQEIATLEQEKQRLNTELITAQGATAKADQAREAVGKELKAALESKRSLESETGKLRTDAEEAKRTSGELRRERDLLSTKADDLERQLTNTRQELASSQKALEAANTHIAALEKEKEQVTVALTDVRSEARDLETRLTAEKAQTASLQEEKQKLLGGTTTAQDEIARLQKRAGELETTAARAQDLEKQVSEQNQIIGELRQAAADREKLAAQASTLGSDLEQNKQRVATLTTELAAISGESAQLRQERDQLKTDLQAAQQVARSSQEQLTRLQAISAERETDLERTKAIAAARESDLERIRQERGTLQTQLKEQTLELKMSEVELARVEQEKAAKEAELKRLTQAQEDLTKSLQSEIDKGNIRIQQIKDRLTINMLDKVLFDSGKSEVKPTGLTVLKQVSDVVKTIKDKQIRIEGHTDNVPIGSRLQEKFPTNWELSTARATSVVRFLIERGGVDRSNIAAVGYADTRPVASNDTDEGKASNRRIEITLYPKELTEVVEKR